MASQYGRRQYFSTLRQYQINNKEWESIIRKVNQKESGLSELFQNAKDEKDLVEKLVSCVPIEDKLNQEKNKIDEFRKLAFQLLTVSEQSVEDPPARESLSSILRTQNR